MTGGYGLDGSYDKTWKGRGDGAVALYRKGEKARAYWYLGHIAHLVEDATENGGWSAWERIPGSGGPSASFTGGIGSRYEFRVSAADAAGNLGRSM